MEIRIIKEDKYYKQIIEELRKEYGIKRIGDTYMSQERLMQNYNKYKNGELDVIGLFDNDELIAFSSYKITSDGLYGADIMTFSNHRGKGCGSIIVNYLLEYAKEHGCEQMYFGARRSANKFYYGLGFEGTCLIQSAIASKKQLEELLNKYNVNEYEYNLYQNTVQQFFIDAKYIDDNEFVNELDNSDLDIGCILTFSKKIVHNKNKDKMINRD